MNPGVSAARTAVLPRCAATASTRAITTGAVVGVAMTSTRRITGTGLKKWRPMTCSGRVVAAAMAATDSELVLVARMCPARRPHRVWRSLLLELEVLGDGLDDQVGGGQIFEVGRAAQPGVDRRGHAAIEMSPGHLALEERVDPVAGPLPGHGRGVEYQDLVSRLGGHLGNAGAHRPRPQHPDPTDRLHGTGQWPLKRGSRFSPKAATPSAWSAVRPAISWSAASVSMLAARSSCSAAFSRRLA